MNFGLNEHPSGLRRLGTIADALDPAALSLEELQMDLQMESTLAASLGVQNAKLEAAAAAAARRIAFLESANATMDTQLQAFRGHKGQQLSVRTLSLLSNAGFCRHPLAPPLPAESGSGLVVATPTAAATLAPAALPAQGQHEHQTPLPSTGGDDPLLLERLRAVLERLEAVDPLMLGRLRSVLERLEGAAQPFSQVRFMRSMYPTWTYPSS